MSLYEFLDHFFVVFHFSLILFNLFGWMWPKTRRLHLYVISATIISWVGLGSFYGWGYCPCTDWHWQVKRELGEVGLPASYIKYYLDSLTGMHWDAFVVDAVTAGAGIAVFMISIWLNVKDVRSKQVE